MGNLYPEVGVDLSDLDSSFLTQLCLCARAIPCDLRATSGYRTRAAQARLYDLFCRHHGNPANPPGHSLHELGKACDIHPDPETPSNWSLLREAAPRFGLVFPYQDREPWHCQPSFNLK